MRERLLAFPALTLYGLLVDPVTGGGGLPCLWLFCFGTACWGCGLSRANALFWRGHVAQAVDMNGAIVAVVSLAAAAWFSTIVTLLARGKKHG